jgi:hypothetical protein
MKQVALLLYLTNEPQNTIKFGVILKFLEVRSHSGQVCFDRSIKANWNGHGLELGANSGYFSSDHMQNELYGLL